MMKMWSVTSVSQHKNLHQELHTSFFFLCLPEQSGRIDMTFFTHDCFHFTIKGHEELAKGLWNNMVNNNNELFDCF